MPQPDAVSRISSMLGSAPLTLKPMVVAVKKAAPRVAVEQMRTVSLRPPEQCDLGEDLVGEVQHVAEMIVPTGWLKGQLLNVRNKGEYYAVTILGEEEDPRYPERALRFANSVTCQAFVSKWYQREHHDPRAF